MVVGFVIELVLFVLSEECVDGVMYFDEFMDELVDVLVELFRFG